MFCSLNKVAARKTDIGFDLKLLKKGFQAYQKQEINDQVRVGGGALTGPEPDRLRVKHLPPNSFWMQVNSSTYFRFLY